VTPDPGATRARDARREAAEIVGASLEVQVLEPSPPAITDAWFADDPVADPPAPSSSVVTPIPGRGTTWDAWTAEHPDRAPWVSARWLGAYRRLGPPPPTFAATRAALHRLAVYVVSPARRRVNGKIGLRYTYRGFGTPFFGRDEQIRLVGNMLVWQRDGDASADPVDTLARAAAFVLDDVPDETGNERLDVPPLRDPSAPLAIDPVAAAYLGDWYGFAYSVLEELRSDASSTEPSRVQLWPEHFDAAFECLSDDLGRRATFGASPGDAQVAEPYLYVTPWHFGELAPSARWNATTFRGAILLLSDMIRAADQRRAALDFFRERRDLLMLTG
jgi:hypothetical protein